MEERFFFVAYASSASTDLSREELTDLLAVSRERNAAAGVTGLLVHKGGNFLQALEGAEDAVRATMQRISRDPRHRSIIKLHEGYHDERLFREWAMGFEDVARLDPSVVAGVSQFLTDGVIAQASEQDDADVYAFFREFREHMR